MTRFSRRRFFSLYIITTLFIVFAFILIAADAFAFAVTRGAFYKGQGNGTEFRVFAPHASSVSVAGDWNGWDPDADPLQKGDFDVWYGSIPEAERYMEYRFVINGGEFWRKDPNSFLVEHSGWDANSVIADFGHYQWSDNEDNWQSGAHVPAVTEMVIYELHLKSFMFKNDGVPYEHGNMFNLFVEHKLDYLQNLGINCVLFMPVTEFPGDQSWGYNPAFWFAPESSYGTAYDFQRLVDECHKRGIAVLVDVVYNHAGPTDIEHYWNFDGGWIHDEGGNGNYFYTDWRARTPWGDTNPDFGKWEVREMLAENAAMWIQEYHCDGLRLDSTVTIRKDAEDGFDWNGSDNPDGWGFLQQVNNRIRPQKGSRVVTLAEDIAGNSWITKNTNEGGAGFTAQWQPSPIVNVVTQWDDNNRDMNQVASAVGAYLGVNYGLHEIVKYHSSHDTVDARNDHWRLPNRIGDPFSWYAYKRSKLATGVILGAPGTPMIFQGDEFYSKGQWDDDPDRAIDWNELEWNRPYWEYVRAMIRLKTGGKHGAMRTNNLEIPVIDNDMKIVSWKRWDDSGDILIFVTNFRGSEQTRGIPFPEDGTWYEIVNSDAALYGGDNVGNGGAVNASGGWADVRIGSYSMIVFSKTQDVYPPSKATDPNPADGAHGAAPDPTLSWRRASDTSSYNVFLGTDETAVQNAGDADPEFMGNVTETFYEASGLSPWTEYFWRVDSVGAGVTKGDSWSFTTAANDSGVSGRAGWTPEKPAAGGSVRIWYFPEDGPLQGASTMYLHWGINGWKNVVDAIMTEDGENKWRIDLTVPASASTLNFAFTTNPTGGDWDNNGGRDWNVEVIPTQPRVEWSPEEPIAGSSMTITYHADLGPLPEGSDIYIHLGYNDWTGNVIREMMTNESGDTWTYDYAIPGEAIQVDFVFTDGPEGAAENWDNNDTLDWHVPVKSGDIPLWGVSQNHLRPETFAGRDAQGWTVTYWNAGQGSLWWEASKVDAGSGTDWFNISPGSGESTGADDRTAVDVSFDTDALSPGVYKARIKATETRGLLADHFTSVTLTVNPLHEIIVTPNALAFDLPTTKTRSEFSVTNQSGVNMPYTVSVKDPAAHSWITVSPSSGIYYGNPAIAQAEIDMTGKDRRTYAAEIELKADDSSNSPVIIPVTVTPINFGWYLY